MCHFNGRHLPVCFTSDMSYNNNKRWQGRAHRALFMFTFSLHSITLDT